MKIFSIVLGIVLVPIILVMAIFALAFSFCATGAVLYVLFGVFSKFYKKIVYSVSLLQSPDSRKTHSRGTLVLIIEIITAAAAVLSIPFIEHSKSIPSWFIQIIPILYIILNTSALVFISCVIIIGIINVQAYNNYRANWRNNEEKVLQSIESNPEIRDEVIELIMKGHTVELSKKYPKIYDELHLPHLWVSYRTTKITIILSTQVFCCILINILKL